MASDVERQSSEVWARADTRGDAAGLADYLARVTALEWVQAYKRRGYAALGVAEGARVLDVGCGVGDDVRGIADLVGQTGQVVGLDVTEKFLEEARRQSVNYPMVDYRQGDAHALPFPDAAFHAARSERVVQHLTDPAAAVAEMRRVTRPGGRVVVTEPDWDTLVVDLPGRAGLTRQILAVGTDSARRNGRIGRELPRLFREAGLTQIDVMPAAVFVADYRVANEGCTLEYAAELAREAGVVSRADATAWIEALRAQAVTGEFWCAMMVFTVVGHRT